MSNSRTTRDLRTPAQRDRRPWRVAFVAYAALLTVATHWPALRLPPAVPTTDKTIHFIAFGVLALLLWRTRWLRPRWLAAAVALAWAVVDEMSQGIPGLNRHVTWEDGAANALGVVVVLAWAAALRPVGGPTNRRRIAREQIAVDRLFGSPRTWYVTGAILLVCAAPVAIVWSLLDASVVSRIFLIAVLFWAGATTITLRTGWRAARLGVARDQPCFACGTPCARLAFDRQGHAACPACGHAARFGQWSGGPAPTADTRVRVGLRAAAAGAIVIVGAVALLLASAVARGRAMGSTADLAALVQDLINTLPPTLTTTVDLACLLLLLAAGAFVYRWGLARHYDAREQCRMCGHDLRATPMVRGTGRCGECGTLFFEDADARAKADTRTDSDTDTDTGAGA